VTFNDVDTYDYFRDHIVDLADADHDPTDYDDARSRILEPDTEYQGVVYRDPDSVPYRDRHGVDGNMADVPDGAPEGATDLVREFY
jgi:2-oxoglutarate ferredoxin oxidoreductase subunit beta